MKETIYRVITNNRVKEFFDYQKSHFHFVKGRNEQKNVELWEVIYIIEPGQRTFATARLLNYEYQ